MPEQACQHAWHSGYRAWGQGGGGERAAVVAQGREQHAPQELKEVQCDRSPVCKRESGKI